MGIFNRAIPKYTRNPIDNTIKVEPVTESVQEPNIEPVALVDDAFDPLFNKAVRKRLVDMHGDPFTATLSGYAELLETAIGGNRDKGGNVLPGVGILSSFGRTMDKAGDFILGGITEGVKGVTGQGMENPLYNIFTQDQDYSGQRFLTAAANSMSKMAGDTKLTEGDFKGLWSVPSLGIELMTDPSILGGGLTRVAKGTGAVADAGRILQEYDDIMAKFAIDATAPGLRPLGKKFGAKVGSYIHNLRTEQALKNAILEGKEVLKKAVIDFNGGTITEEQFNQIVQDVSKRVGEFKKVADQDPIAAPLKQMADDVERATQSSSPLVASDFDNFLKTITETSEHGKMISHGKKVSKTLSEDFDMRAQALSEILDIYSKTIPKREHDIVDYISSYKSDPNKFFDDFRVSKAYTDYDISSSEKLRNKLKGVEESSLEQNIKRYEDMQSQEDIELDFLQRLPNEFLEKYKISSRQDFLNVLRSDLSPEQATEVNNVLNDLAYKSGLSTRGRVKVSQSVSKLPARTQLFINNEQQRIVSSIITYAVHHGLVDPKNISEDTLDELFNTLYSFIRTYPTSSSETVGKSLNRLYALNHYRFNAFKHLSDKMVDIIKPVWDTPLVKVSLLRDKQHSNFKNMESYAKYLTIKLSDDTNNLMDELSQLTSKGVPETDPEYVRLVDEFMNDEVFPATGATRKDLVGMLLSDEKSGSIKFSKKGRFENLTSRNQVKTSDSMKEFGEFSKLIRSYTSYLENRIKRGEPAELGAKIPTVYKHPQLYYKDKLGDPRFKKHVTSYVKKSTAEAKRWEGLLEYIKKEIIQYEQNIGSKIGGRYFSDDLQGLKEIGKTTEDSTLGISKTINDIIANVDFKNPMEVYKFMHTPIKTSVGTFTLSDLGFEVTHLPEEMLKPIHERTVKAFTTPVKIGSSDPITLEDLIIKKMLEAKDSIRKEWGGLQILSEADVSKHILSKENYTKYVEKTVGMSWDEFVRRCTALDVSKLVYDKKAIEVLNKASLQISPNDLLESLPDLTKRVRTRGGMVKKFKLAGIPKHILKEHGSKKYATKLESIVAMEKLLQKEYILLSLKEAGLDPKHLEKASQIDVLNGGSLEDIIYEVQHSRSKEYIFQHITDPSIYLKSWLNDFKYAKTNKAYQFLNRLRPNLGKMSNEAYNAYLKNLNIGRELLFDYTTRTTFDIHDTATFETLKQLKELNPKLNILNVQNVFDFLKENVTDPDTYSKMVSDLKIISQDVEDYTVSGVFPAHIGDISKISDSKIEDAAISSIEKLPDESFEQLVTNQWKIYQEADLEKRAEMLNKAFPDKEPITAAELKLYEEFGQGGKSPVTRTIEEHHPVKIRLYDLLSKEFRNSIVSKQDRNAVLELPKLKEIIEESVRLQGVAGDEMPKILTLLDKQKGSMVRGTDFLTDLALAKGRKIIAYKDVNDGKLVKDVLVSIQSNVDAVNNAAGGEVIKVINHVNEAGQHIVGYRLVGNQKLFKNLSKNLDGLRLNDIVFEPVSALTKEEADFLATYSPVVEHLANVQREASEYYRKIGFQYNDPSFFKHTFDNSKFFQDTVNNNYYKGLDIKRSEGLSDMIIDLGYFGDLRGQFGAVPNSRIFEGNISRYGDMFDTNINSITKSTFTKGVFANEKFQTTMSIFDNNEFRLNTYCKNLDDVKNILNSEANLRNLTIASVEYKDGMIYGFKKYDNFSDSSLTKALQDENAVFLPTHIFSTLDKFCKQRIRMSNKVYAFINRYLTAPFKIGVLLNPGFLLGNINDAYLKQATTMSKKYGTSVSEELANVASSMRTTMFLNNRFSDVYDAYLKDMETYGIDIPANYKMSLQVAKSKGARDQFIKYLNGTLEGFDKSTGKKYLINPNLTEEDIGVSRVWIYLNAVQPTEGITKELAGDLVENGAGKVNYAKNPVDRILYGLRYYKPSDITTHGLLNNLGTKSVFGMSEATESLARSAAILNDLRHQGIDLTEFGKILGSTADTEFNVKMINAINAMHNANFDYNASSPLLEGLEGFVPFPTFWIKNLGYWFDMFINHPQYIDAALQVNEGLWANEDTSEDEFKADAKSRGAIPLSAFNEPKSGQKLSNFFKGIYKPSPLQSMFTAFGTLNNPIETTFQRTHPLIQGATAVAGTEPMFNNLTTYLQNPEDMRYRPYNTDQYQPNIDSTEEGFNPLAYTGHKLNPFDRAINTYLRTPGKVKRGEAQLSDFLPSVFQPDFSKK